MQIHTLMREIIVVRERAYVRVYIYAASRFMYNIIGSEKRQGRKRRKISSVFVRSASDKYRY